MSSIKANRAFSKSRVGQFTQTAAAAWDCIPASVYARCTGAELAELMDAFHAAFRATKSIHERDIVDEGAIWSNRDQRLLEIER